MTETLHSDRHNDVMVSSTTLDLPEHRDKVLDAILRRGCFPRMMEHATATGETALDFSLRLVDLAEVYIGIFGYRYGFIPNDPVKNPNKLSITELEYRRALERGIPVRCFFMGDDHPGPKVSERKNFYETDPDKEVKLEALKAEIGKTVVGFFNSPQELHGHVFQALTDLLDAGKLKADKGGKKDNSLSIIPIKPTPYIAHPYILTRKFFGRKHELGLLDAWALNDDLRVMIVEAIGGVGKSALTWEWFNQNAKNYDGAMWWSFYDSDSSVTNFVRHALTYLTGQPLADFNTITAESEKLLLKLFSEERYLLAFDGIERIMVAYHRMDAARLADETIDDSRELRTFTDPKHGELIRNLALCSSLKLLISTRLQPADLEDKSHQLIDGVELLQLAGLADEDALALIRHIGIKGQTLSLKRFMRQFDNHSLLIGIIAGRIHDYRQSPGDFDDWYSDKDEGQSLKLHDLDLVQSRTHILHYALAGLRPELMKLLGQIAAFRYALHYDTLAAFNPYLPSQPIEPQKPNDEADRLAYWRDKLNDPDDYKERIQIQSEIKRIEAKVENALTTYRKSRIYRYYQQELNNYEKKAHETRGNFHSVLAELENRGLLQWDRINNLYDLHPVVRRYAFEALTTEDQKGAFDRIRDYFAAQIPENLEDIHDISQLNQSLEIYHALIGAGRLDDAAAFYEERLGSVLKDNLATYHPIIELLTPLFVDGLDALPRVTDLRLKSACLNDLASVLKYIGQNERALNLKGVMLKLDLEREDFSDLGVSLLNYGLSLSDDAQLARAHHEFSLALELAEAVGDDNGLAMAHLRLFESYIDMGDWASAEAHYKAFNAKPLINQYAFWQGYAECKYAYMQILCGLDGIAALDRAEVFIRQFQNSLGRILQGLRGAVALQAGEFEKAILYFNEVITRSRVAGINFDYLLNNLAYIHAAQGRRDEALALLEETENKPAGSAAEVYWTLGDREQARNYALEAYEDAWADGPPYISWWELERAKKVLDDLGEPYPDMPPFDPAKIEPIPYEDEIRALIEKLKAEKKK